MVREANYTLLQLNLLFGFDERDAIIHTGLHNTQHGPSLIEACGPD